MMKDIFAVRIARVFLILVWAVAFLSFVFYWVAFQWYGAFRILLVWTAIAVPLATLSWWFRGIPWRVMGIRVISSMWGALLVTGVVLSAVGSFPGDFWGKDYLHLPSVQRVLSIMALVVVTIITMVMVYTLSKKVNSGS
jgi:hypothetical protein